MSDPMQAPIGVPRPLLMFNSDARVSHKIRHIIEGFKTCKIEVEAFQVGDYDRHMEKECYVPIDFGIGTTMEDRQKAFIIGSVQEPCMDYLQLWASGSHRKGAIRQYALDYGVPEDFYGQDGPTFDSKEDIARFQKWVQHDAIKGLASAHFWNSYGSYLSGVDCLVYGVNMHASLLTCVEEYQKQGGHVDWSSDALKELVAIVEQEQKLAESTGEPYEVLETGWEKAKIDHHGECTLYFDSFLADTIESGPDSDMYDFFGFDKCCGKDYFDVDELIFEGGAEGHARDHYVPIEDNGEKMGLGKIIFASFLSTLILLGFVSFAIHRRAKQREARTRAARIEKEVYPGSDEGEGDLQPVYLD